MRRSDLRAMACDNDLRRRPHSSIVFYMERALLSLLVAGVKWRSLYILGASYMSYTSFYTIVLYTIYYNSRSLAKQTEGLFWAERLVNLLAFLGIDSDPASRLALTLFAVTNTLYVYVSWLSRKDIKRKFPQPLRAHLLRAKSRACPCFIREAVAYLISKIKGVDEDEDDGISSGSEVIAMDEKLEACQLERDRTLDAEGGRECRRESTEETVSQPQGSDCCSGCLEKDELIHRLQEMNFDLDAALAEEKLETEGLSVVLDELEQQHADLLSKIHSCCCHEKDDAVRALQDENVMLKERLAGTVRGDSELEELLYRSEEKCKNLAVRLEWAHALCEFYRNCIHQMVYEH